MLGVKGTCYATTTIGVLKGNPKRHQPFVGSAEKKTHPGWLVAVFFSAIGDPEMTGVDVPPRGQPKGVPFLGTPTWMSGSFLVSLNHPKRNHTLMGGFDGILRLIQAIGF